jgi:hypothetical protein
MGWKRVVVGLVMVAVLSGGYLVVGSNGKPSKAWRLTRREILLELCGENGFVAQIGYESRSFPLLASSFVQTPTPSPF